MEIFKDLAIEGNPDLLKECMKNIDKSLKEGWFRDSKQEESYLKHLGIIDDFGSTINTKELFCINCPKSEKYPAAIIWLSRNDKRIKIDTIALTTVGQIKAEEYNAILDDFYNKFVKDAIGSIDVSLLIDRRVVI